MLDCPRAGEYSEERATKDVEGASYIAVGDEVSVCCRHEAPVPNGQLSMLPRQEALGSLHLFCERALLNAGLVNGSYLAPQVSICMS